MKRGTIEHPKTAALADSLGVELLTAVGLLEALWHFTAKYARLGDVGKFTDQAIADGVHWRGNADDLMRALLSCRFVDEDPTHRLLIHDWADHADGSVRKALKRADEGFAEPTGRIGDPPPSTEPDRMARQNGQTERSDKTAGQKSVAPMPIPRPSRPSQACPVRAHPGQDQPTRSSVNPAVPITEPLATPRTGPEAESCSAAGMGRNERGLTDLLIANGVDEPEAERLVKCAKRERIEQVVQFVQQQSNVGNPGGLIRKLIMDRSRDGELSEAGELANTIEVMRRNKRGGHRSASPTNMADVQPKRIGVTARSGGGNRGRP